MKKNGPWFTAKDLDSTLAMKKVWSSMEITTYYTKPESKRWQLLSLNPEGRPRVEWWPGGVLNLGLSPDTIHVQIGPKRWHNTLSWSHRMNHEPSGVGTRTKTTTSSSPFQRILILLVSMLDEGNIAETVQGCRLNPNRTWQLSWRWLVVWGRTCHAHTQCRDVLIRMQHCY
jgi:hypothetical protein